jgi:general stress protein 26
MAHEPTAELEPGFSSPQAAATPWPETERALDRAGVYWLSTVLPGGGPHVTPLIGVWAEDAMFFCTGPEERKAKNLRRNSACILTTGSNRLDDGMDVVVEGDAIRVTDHAKLERVAAAYLEKYGEDWRFAVRDGAFAHEAGTAFVFEVAPRKVFAFAKGDPFSQTRYRF